MNRIIKITIIGLSCLMPVSSCSKAEHEILKVNGIYDGLSYTSPYALFTTHLEGWADMKSVEDGVENEGASLRLTFKDTDSNEYQIMASFANKNIDAHAMIEQMVKAGQAQGKNAVVAKTADGEECLMARSLVKLENQDQGFGLLTVIFVRNGAIFDMTVKGKPTKEAPEASKYADEAFGELWNRTRFRGQTKALMEYPQDVDPRVPAIASAAEVLADKLGYKSDVTREKKAIVKIFGKGKEGPMTLSLGIAAQGNEIITTEAINAKVNDLDAMKAMQDKYYKTLGNALADEKLTVTRSADMDPDLVMLPTKNEMK